VSVCESMGLMPVDLRPNRGGWVRGPWHVRCTHCHQEFIGAREATLCAPCAYGGNKRSSQLAL
jgi:formylmethanofuran dehydrogenase subunit E